MGFVVDVDVWSRQTGRRLATDVILLQNRSLCCGFDSREVYSSISEMELVAIHIKTRPPSFFVE